MSEPQTNTQAPIEPMRSIMHRMAMPFLMFAAVLFVLLLVSYTLLLPRFTSIHGSNGVAMSPKETVEYERSLRANLISQEAHRTKLVLPITDSTYTEIRAAKQESLSIGDVREQLRQAASRLGEHEASVHIASLSMEGKSVKVRGDIRNVETRSMTVLAAYIEEVEALPFISNFIRPPFTREQSADGSFRSPFEFSFEIAHP
jgi:hypothetical protein